MELRGEPRPRRTTSAGGGVADKLGNRYELSWAVKHALQCITDERRSITFEDLDPELAEGSEFTFIDERGVTAVTQVKRQFSVNDHWTTAALRSRGIFDAASKHVLAGREYHFSSMTPCGPLRGLSERARQSADLEQFTTRHLTKELGPRFDELASPDVLGSADRAWHVLRGMWFEVEDEQQLARTNATIAATLLEGPEESLLPIALGAVLLDNLGRRLFRRELLAELAPHGISTRHVAARRAARDEVSAATRSWRRTVERELLNSPIQRSESADLVELMRRTRLAIVVGAGGGGKSSVLNQSVEILEARGAEVLAFRLDRQGNFNSTTELGMKFGLSSSPVVSLRAAADGRDAFLVIDQLDAVSLASGRLSERFDVVANLIADAMAVEGIRVILACRLFDVENDHRIRKLDARLDVERLAVAPLDATVVATAVRALGLDPTSLTPAQVELLRSPLNLVLLESVASQPNALDFTSRGSLLEAFWHRKLQSVKNHRPEVRFNEVLARVANTASDQQSLSIAVELLDAEDYVVDAHVLASEQVLAIDGGRVSFFHEAFFDYTFARQWLLREQSMTEFLLVQEQELFRRAQVRQVLELLRERDPVRFRTEVEAVLNSSGIRFHIKETIFVVLANASSPVDLDVELILRIGSRDPALGEHLWQHICSPNWFGALFDKGLIETWMDSDHQELRDRAAGWLANAGPGHSVTVARLVQQRRHTPDYIRWIRWLTERADLHQNRPLFDLMLEVVRTGGLDPVGQSLWLSVHDLAEHDPSMAVELLDACLTDNSFGLTLNSDGKIGFLDHHDYSAGQLIERASQSEPLAFLDVVIPYLLRVMRATHLDPAPGELVYDLHFGLLYPTRQGSDDIGEALYDGATTALISLASTDPTAIGPLLRALSTDEHEASQALLYRALIGGAEHYAGWAAELLLEGGRRLKSGYLSSSNWISRELVEAIAPHVSDATHTRLEEQFRDIRLPREHGHLFGYTAFKFLSALHAPRLSPVGARRLAEYRRKFGVQGAPQPTGVTTYVVGSPIAAKAASKMSDAQWLRAMARHRDDERNADRSFGGARELSQVLKAQTTEDPAKFARLALQMNSEVNPAYPSAILWGFGDATIPTNLHEAVFDAIRHVIGLQLPACDRWLGWAVRQLLDSTPLDLVELIRDRALRAPDPEEDRPAFARQREHRHRRDLRQDGMNTARGALAQELGDLLIRDVDGQRTASVEPYLSALAIDPIPSVRACVAHTIAACLRHARSTAYDAFGQLIDTADALLASDSVEALMIFIGNVDPDRIYPVIDRMLRSDEPEVRRAGGRIAAYASLEWNRPQLMERVLASDADTRCGAAVVCSGRVDRAADFELVISTLRQLMHDEDDDVRKAVGLVAQNLRGRRLQPFTPLLADLIASPSYVHATPQLLIALQEAPDEVDLLVDLAAHRFLDVFGANVADIRTRAAGEARYISDLVVRGLAQTHDRVRVSALLDILDRLVEHGGYSIQRALEHVERS